MNTEILLDRFRKMLSMEEKIKERYNYYIEKINDDKLKKKLIRIRDEEADHEKIVEKLIGYIS